MRWIAGALTSSMLCLLGASTAWALSPFTVFFDSNSVHLDARAIAILDNAAQGIRTADARRIVVTGGADRRGSRSYNLDLSRRRAEAVRAALIARGVPAHIIVVEAAGEDQPVAETADGVAEAQNRYATVILMQICGDLPGFQADTGC